MDMHNELMLYTQGVERAPRHDRQVAAMAKRVYDEVRLKAMEADGAMALGGHMMEGLTALNAKRQSLSNGDPMVDVMLAEVMANTIRQCKNIQNGLFDSWGL